MPALLLANALLAVVLRLLHAVGILTNDDKMPYFSGTFLILEQHIWKDIIVKVILLALEKSEMPEKEFVKFDAGQSVGCIRLHKRAEARYYVHMRNFCFENP